MIVNKSRHLLIFFLPSLPLGGGQDNGASVSLTRRGEESLTKLRFRTEQLADLTWTIFFAFPWVLFNTLRRGGFVTRVVAVTSLAEVAQNRVIEVVTAHQPHLFFGGKK